MHVVKYKLTQVGHILKHCERAKDEKGEYIKFGNKSIDTSRTHLNYNLCPENRGYKFIKERCSEVNFVDRSNTNVMCSWVVTAPKDLPPEESEMFFRGMYDFYCSRYNENNVISAYVHCDEGNRHMHFAFVPIVEDKKTGNLKVSAREAIDRKELKTIHPAAEKYIAEVLGHPVAIMTGELSDRPDLTIEQYKSLKEVEKQLDIAENRHSALIEDIDDLEHQLDDLRAKYSNIEAMEEKAQALLDEIREKSTHKKNKVIIPSDLWEKISELYTDIRIARAVSTAQNKKLSEAQKALAEAQEQLSKIKVSASALEARNRELHEKNIEIEKDLQRVKTAFIASSDLLEHFVKVEKELQKAPEQDLEKY